MNNLTVPNANQLTDKKFLASYVRDAWEIESAILTLKRLEEELDRKAYAKVYEANQRLSECQKQYQKAQNEVLRCNEIVTKTKLELDKATNKLDSLPISQRAEEQRNSRYMSFVKFVQKDINFRLDDYHNGVFIVMSFIFVPFIALPIFICRGLVNYPRERKDHQRYIERMKQDHLDTLEHYRKLCKNIENELHQARQRKKQAEEECDRLKSEQDLAESVVQEARANYFLNQRTNIRQIQNKRKELEKKLQQFYGLGIIPPDYRHTDCIMMLDRFFANDLVNTMQEAIRYYEHKVDIGEIIRGIDKIYRSIDNLNGTMQTVAQRLRQIDDTVFAMHQDLANKMDRQYSMNEETNRAILEESRAGRFAIEQLNQTNQKILFYQEQDYIKNL